MIGAQRQLRYLFLALILVFAVIYLCARYQLMRVSFVAHLKFITLTISAFFWLSGALLANKKVGKLWLVYELAGIGLVIFSIMSVFVLKMEDLYFWSANRAVYQNLFRFSSSVYGWDFVFFLPVVMMLIFESAVLRTTLFRHRSRKEN